MQVCILKIQGSHFVYRMRVNLIVSGTLIQHWHLYVLLRTVTAKQLLSWPTQSWAFNSPTSHSISEKESKGDGKTSQCHPKWFVMCWRRDRRECESWWNDYTVAGMEGEIVCVCVLRRAFGQSADKSLNFNILRGWGKVTPQRKTYL